MIDAPELGILLDQLAEYEQHRFCALNLVASENLMSPLARAVMASDLGHRYCLPPRDECPPEIWDYPNQRELREIHRVTAALACRLFGGARADLRPLSGNNAASILLDSLAVGSVVASVPADCGGHFATVAIAKARGLRQVDLVYDRQSGQIDVDASAARCRETGATLVFLDASTQLFPHPVAELRLALPAVKLVYDASHTMGLIAGGAFQAPLVEGADLLQGSTHKSLFGPQKGIFVFRSADDFCARVQERVCPTFVSNGHPHHVAALGVALAEAARFGAEYAAAVVANARRLGASLARLGADISFADRGCTASHQVVLAIGSRERAEGVFAELEQVGLHTNLIRIPFRTAPCFGFRLGVAELTRRGLDLAGVDELAKLL
ncbi:MAG TPA: hypothetical protein VFG69_12790, partial [Nannocystaceae bacterium]|nr:hypothetical protein [Nannocystaceae bacterium]